MQVAVAVARGTYARMLLKCSDHFVLEYWKLSSASLIFRRKRVTCARISRLHVDNLWGTSPHCVLVKVSMVAPKVQAFALFKLRIPLSVITVPLLEVCVIKDASLNCVL